MILCCGGGEGAAAAVGDRRPDTGTAMRRLIAEIRESLPLDGPGAQVCTGICEACPQKLLEYLATDLDGWEHRLGEGVRPTLADLSQLVRTARQVQAALARRDLPP